MNENGNSLNGNTPHEPDNILAFPAPKVAYLAGPMAGCPDYNFGSFMAADMALGQDGWTVLNPAKNAFESGFDPRGGTHPTNEQGEQFAKWELENVLKATNVFALHGWMSSAGAVAVVAVAQWKGLPVHQIVVKVDPETKSIELGKGVDAPRITEITSIVGQAGANL